ncbi:unnamed protein product [Symbiodinium natans]|uniref:Uncharacterized protein n=1 Tax=Symbiodinium natans TaxID=878477 RepID=A0A812Q526_9DINO|nr:unnamed protein product [Symbiodinium natans]
MRRVAERCWSALPSGHKLLAVRFFRVFGGVYPVFGCRANDWFACARRACETPAKSPVKTGRFSLSGRILDGKSCFCHSPGAIPDFSGPRNITNYILLALWIASNRALAWALMWKSCSPPRSRDVFVACMDGILVLGRWAWMGSAEEDLQFAELQVALSPRRCAYRCRFLTSGLAKGEIVVAYGRRGSPIAKHVVVYGRRDSRNAKLPSFSDVGFHHNPKLSSLLGGFACRDVPPTVRIDVAILAINGRCYWTSNVKKLSSLLVTLDDMRSSGGSKVDDCSANVVGRGRPEVQWLASRLLWSKGSTRRMSGGPVARTPTFAAQYTEGVWNSWSSFEGCFSSANGMFSGSELGVLFAYVWRTLGKLWRFRVVSHCLGSTLA